MSDEAQYLRTERSRGEQLLSKGWHVLTKLHNDVCTKAAGKCQTTQLHMKNDNRHLRNVLNFLSDYERHISEISNSHSVRHESFKYSIS